MRNRTVVIKNFLVFLVNRFSIVNVLFYDAKIYDGEKYLVPYILGYFFEIVIICCYMSLGVNKSTRQQVEILKNYAL